MKEFREPFTVVNCADQKLFGVFHRPVGLRIGPAVIFCHGFGGNKMGHLRLYVLLAEALSRIGIASVRFDFRGCGDSEGVFKENLLTDFFSDLDAVMEFVHQRDWIDKEALGFLGISLGGALAVRYAAKNKQPKSLALWAPVASGLLWLQDWQRHHEGVSLEEYNKHSPRSVHPLFIEQFAALNVESDLPLLQDVPMLHIASSMDSNVQPHHGEIYKKGRQGACQSQFVQLDKSEHDFVADMTSVLQETVQWFKKSLLEPSTSYTL